MSGAPTPLMIGIGGGKGGVGKSLIAANLGIAIAELGFRTVLVDADLGAPNQHTLFGMDRPGLTLGQFLRKEVDSLEEVVRPTGARRLFLVPGVGAIHGAANLPHAQKLKVLRHIRRLDAEVVLIDVGAGVSFNVLDFFEAADLRLVVTTPQLPALQNAYCFLKAAVYRGLHKRIENHAQREAFKAATARIETERIRDLRDRAAHFDAGLDDAFDQVTGGFATRVVGNMLEGPHQRKVMLALTRMAHDFLDIELPLAATLPMSRFMHESVTQRRPFLLSHSTSAAAGTLRELASTLVTTDVEAIRAQRKAVRAAAIMEPEVRPQTQASLIDYLRRDERVEVRHAARVSADGPPRRARVIDLSARGLMVDGELGVDIGDELEIGLVGLPGGLRLRGRVRFVSVSGSKTGVELDAASVAVAERVLREAPRVSSTLPPPKPVAVGGSNSSPRRVDRFSR